MDLVNQTRCDVQATQAIDREGAPWLVVMAKATYLIGGHAGQPPRPAAPANPLRATDVFEGEPGLSAPLFESDSVPFKALCDVVVKGGAHAPWLDGAPQAVRHLDVGLLVRSAQGREMLNKTIRVYGERRWHRRLRGWAVGQAEPFSVMPVSYGRAFGGLYTHEDLGSDDPHDFAAHPMNLVGRGFAPGRFARLLRDAPAHQTELWVRGRLQAVNDPREVHTPASLGPVARNWQPRLAWAGTYDEAWRNDVFPLPPADFDDRFFQCAPPDQQMPYPQGGETVTLAHLTLAAAQDAQSRGLLSFMLPRRAMSVRVLTRSRHAHVMAAHIDTVAIDADAMTFDVTWRTRLRLRRGLHEVHTVVVGPVHQTWWNARVGGGAGCAGCDEDEVAAFAAPAIEESA